MLDVYHKWFVCHQMEHLSQKKSEMSASYESQLNDLEQRFEARLEKEAARSKRKCDALTANLNKVRCSCSCVVRNQDLLLSTVVIRLLHNVSVEFPSCPIDHSDDVFLFALYSFHGNIWALCSSKKVSQKVLKMSENR